jgi:hypothetical protein
MPLPVDHLSGAIAKGWVWPGVGHRQLDRQMAVAAALCGKGLWDGPAVCMGGEKRLPTTVSQTKSGRGEGYRVPLICFVLQFSPVA